MAMDKILENPKSISVGGRDDVYRHGQKIDSAEKPVKDGKGGLRDLHTLIWISKFAYKVDSFYSSSHDRGIAYDDPELDINWKLPSSQIKSSDKDKKHPNLQDALDLFE